MDTDTMELELAMEVYLKLADIVNLPDPTDNPVCPATQMAEIISEAILEGYNRGYNRGYIQGLSNERNRIKAVLPNRIKAVLPNYYKTSN